jgi:hypothetical protein
MKRRASSKRFFAGLVTVLLLAYSYIYGKAQGIALVTLADPINVRTLVGQVQAPDKSAVQNAHVELFDLKTGKTLASVTTDANGGFHFENFGKSEYKLMISAHGFNPLQATLHIRKNGPASAVITVTIAT